MLASLPNLSLGGTISVVYQVHHIAYPRRVVKKRGGAFSTSLPNLSIDLLLALVYGSGVRQSRMGPTHRAMGT